MPKRLSILRHRLIINRLRAFPSSFDELNDYLRSVSVDGEDYTFHQRTFQREIQEIAAIYDTEITYNRAAGYYEVTAEPEHLDRFWETFDVHNSLIGPPSQYVIPEKRRALGTAHMHSLLHAIKNQCEISFTHQKYWEDEAAVTIRSTKPLALKEARGRWYLIAIDNKDGQIKTFGLDRISALEITTTIFIYPENYNPEVAFSESFGIINDSYAQRVVLSFNFEQGRFAKSYPLHHSQKELLVTDDEYRVGLFIQPTYDFVMELLSLGSDVKVLEPQSLIHEMKMKLQQALALY